MIIEQPVRNDLISRILLGGSCWLMIWITLPGTSAICQEASPSVETETSYWTEVFSGKRVVQIDLHVSSQNWEAMQPRSGQREFRGPPGGGENEFSYAHAALTIDGKKLENIGLRFKGNSSYRSSQRGLRRPFKIDTNRFVKGLKWFGRTKLNLSNSFKDSTYLREKLGYEIFQAAGLPTPGVGWAHVTLTVAGRHERQDLGLYVLIEQVDDDWIQRKFGRKSDNSLLMKPEGFFEWPYLGEELAAYERYEIKEGRENTVLLKRFVGFLRLLKEAEQAEFAERAGEYLDLENWAQYFAANSLLVNLDSIVAMPHNYYLLVDQADGKLKILPWDLNECFGVFTVGASPEDLMHWDIKRPWVMQNQLLERMFGLRDFQRHYQKAVKDLLASAFRPESINRRLAELQPGLEAAMKQNGFSSEIGAMREGIDGRQPGRENFGERSTGLKYFVKERVASVERQLAGTEEGVQLQRSMRRGGGGPPGRKPTGRPIPGMAVIEVLDVDRNGILSREEIRSAAARLRKLDHNGDGKLSLSEYESQRRPGNEGPRVPPRPR